MSNLGNTVSQRVNPALTVGLAFGTINAGSNLSVDVNITPSPALNPARDLALAMPRTAVVQPLSFFATIIDADTIRVTGVNASAGNVAAGNMDMTIFILKGVGGQIG